MRGKKKEKERDNVFACTRVGPGTGILHVVMELYSAFSPLNRQADGVLVCGKGRQKLFNKAFSKLLLSDDA